MRSTPKFSVCLVAISVSCAGALFLYSSSVRSQEGKKANPRLKELQQKRLALLEETRDAAKELFQHSRLSFDEVHEAEREFLAARLEYAETKAERIKVCDAAIQEAQQWQEFMNAKREAAQVTIIPVRKADAYLLELQIAREKAVAGE